MGGTLDTLRGTSSTPRGGCCGNVYLSCETVVCVSLIQVCRCGGAKMRGLSTRTTDGGLCNVAMPVVATRAARRRKHGGPHTPFCTMCGFVLSSLTSTRRLLDSCRHPAGGLPYAPIIRNLVTHV